MWLLYQRWQVAGWRIWWAKFDHGQCWSIFICTTMTNSIFTISHYWSQGENKSLKSEDGSVYDFWLLSEADATLIKEFRTQVSSLSGKIIQLCVHTLTRSQCPCQSVDLERCFKESKLPRIPQGKLRLDRHDHCMLARASTHLQAVVLRNGVKIRSNPIRAKSPPTHNPKSQPSQFRKQSLRQWKRAFKHTG